MIADTWDQVFNYCDRIEIYKSFSLVNKELNIVAKNMIIDSVDMTKYPKLTFDKLRQLKPKDVTMIVTETYDLDFIQSLTCLGDCHISLNHLTNLKKLDISKCDINSCNVDKLTNLEHLATYKTNLSHLTDLRRFDWISSHFIIANENILPLTNLTRLDLGGNRVGLGYNKAQNLRDNCRVDYVALNQVPKLTWLRLPTCYEIDNVNLTYLDVSSDIKYLDKMTNLKELRLIINKVETAHNIMKLTNLKSLTIEKSSINLRRALILPNLLELTLLDCEVNLPASLIKLTLDHFANINDRDLLHLTNLTELVASRHIRDVNHLTNLRILTTNTKNISCLDNLTNLTRLDLSNNNRINWVSRLTKLEELHITKHNRLNEIPKVKRLYLNGRLVKF